MDRLKELAVSDAGWTFDKEKSGVIIAHRYQEDSPIVMLRGKTTINATIDTVLKTTEDYETRKTWDELFNSGEVLQQIDENHQIITFRFKSPSMVVTNRDFVMSRGIKKNDDGTVLSNHVSVVFPNHPEQKGYVRGEVDVSGYYFEPQGDKCVVTYVVQIDPKGWIPSVVVNSVASKQPLILAKLRDFLEK